MKHDDSVDDHINGLLAAMVKLEEKTGERVVADFVTWRGMMTKVSSDIQRWYLPSSSGVMYILITIADHVSPLRPSK